MATRRTTRKKRRSGLVRAPGAGRNEALRPGGGTHRPAHEKRAADRLRRDVDERLDDSE